MALRLVRIVFRRKGSPQCEVQLPRGESVIVGVGHDLRVTAELLHDRQGWRPEHVDVAESHHVAVVGTPDLDRVDPGRGSRRHRNPH